MRRVTAAILRAVRGEDEAVDPEAPSPHLLVGGELDAEAVAARWIWGGGLAGLRGQVPALEAERVLAVRGVPTADRMVAAGIRLRDIPIGDIGLLAETALAVVGSNSRDVRSGTPIAVVPTLAGRTMPFLARLAGSREACVVDLGRDSLEPLHQVAAADVVVAQDLQGLVWAEAFGKPAVWVADRSDDEHDFRFRDWFSVVFERQDRPVPLGGRLESLIAEARRAYHARPVAELGEALMRGLGQPG
ncbi:MAG: hypothetical protein INR65_10680 [Gluconacetobacter diazotrophicus]|nr:hypothetical protein [Gluconacetobacter diazotrophicus]